MIDILNGEEEEDTEELLAQIFSCMDN